jgi:PAS domain S-box-containing protein
MRTRVQHLEAFVVEAQGVRTVEALCDLAASAAAHLTGVADVMTWCADRGAGTVEHFAGFAGLEPGPVKTPAEWPTLIEQAIGAGVTGRQVDVQRGDVGLPSGAPFASVDWVAARRTEARGYWVGVLSSREGDALSHEDTSYMQLLVHHMALLHEVLRGGFRQEADEFWYRKFVQELPAITYARGLDKPGVAGFISPQSLAILGYEPEEFIGNREFFYERLHPEDRVRVLEEQANFAPGERTTIQTVNYRMLHKNGDVVWLLNHVRTVREEDGTPKFVTGVIIDVSEPERRVQENAAQAAEEEELRRRAQSESQAKSGFLAQMSHELRTPLNGILGTCEALQEGTYGPLKAIQHEALTNIERSGRHQLALVNDLLDLSKIEAGGFTPILEPISLVDICEESVQMIRAKAKLAGIRLGLSMDGEVDQIVSDDRRVRQMLLNLLGNAVKFTPEGGRAGVDLEVRGEHAVLSVWDTGIGMPAAEIPRLFEAFTQLDSTLQRKHDGSGLGLNLTSKLAAALGGRIDVESIEGEGSRFILSLPLRIPEADLQGLESAFSGPADPLMAGVRPGVEGHDGEPEPDAAGLQVLLVDDNPANTGHVRDYLQSKGHRVTVVANGLDALEQAQSLPDIVFMDIQMPEMDGVEAIRRLRAEAHTRHLYVVALTSLAMDEDRARCVEAGADDYYPKPVGLRVLLGLVEGRRGLRGEG